MAQSQNDLVKKYEDIAKKIIEKSNADNSNWERLAYMCDVYGPRLSGSENLNNAIEWIYQEMKKDGLVNVIKDPVMVPHWVRGKETCTLLKPRKADIPLLALGGSIGTPKEGITALVIVVKSKEELAEKASKVKGKIVLFNQPWMGYGKSVQYRVHGAKWAAEYGAVASLIRSVSPIGMRVPHTGMMLYEDTIKKIPHAAITLEDAEMLDRLQSYGIQAEIHLYMEAKTLTDTESYNVMGEITGSEFPDEIIAVGGHIDSWDAGTGAHDDGSGCVATWQAVKLLHDLGLKPKRTIRAVMWVNEENGVRGGKDYADKHSDEFHKLLFEFDAGTFPFEFLRYTGSKEAFDYLKSMEPLFKMVNKDATVVEGGWGVDIRPLAEMNNVPVIALGTKDDDKYFWYHHATNDTADKVDPKHMNECVAAIALALYIYADLPQEIKDKNIKENTNDKK